jgi:predicted acyl esterase
VSNLYVVTVQHNVRLRMRDGVELSANLWIPTPRRLGETFPAIFEMIPYRKDDWRRRGVFPQELARQQSQVLDRVAAEPVD